MTAWDRAGREPRHLIHGWYAELQRAATRRGDRLVMRANRRWIAFRSERQRRVFAEIRPSRRRVEVFILPERKALDDPSGIAKAAPASQGWNWFRTKFYVVGNGNARAALLLLKQSYLYEGQRLRRSPSLPRGRQARIDGVLAGK